MQRIIHLIILCLSTFLMAFGNDKPVKTSNEVFKPRHDGKHFFIVPKAEVAQPTQADIESAIADAQTQGRIIKITSVGFSIPAALKEITSLPVTFRNQIDGWNYDITVFAMTFTPQGSKLSIGCKFNLPNNQAIYFGANDIATSGKNGFVGELPILTSTLSDSKQAELDDTGGLLGGETQFYEVSIPNFNDKLKMGLSKDTKLHFECGTFKKFTLSGYLKSFDVVERENNDGTTINDGKPLMLFFGTKDVFDWQDMYFEASVSRSFHHANLKELGFNFSASNKAIIDLSKTQNPANLPTCVNADGWQGVYFPTFQVRLPQFFKLRAGVTLASRTGKNLFIDKTGLLGNMTAEKVYTLNEGYTDEVNQFDMSLDLLSSNFVCNQAPVVTILGRIQLGKCSSSSNQADKLLYYSVIYDKIRNGYSFLVKEKESGNYSSNSLTLETGSTVNFGISGSSLVLNAKLPKTPIITTAAAAFNNSICSNFETTLNLSDCSTGMFKWTSPTGVGNENVNPLTIKPITTQSSQQMVYQANCFDKYCINENSNAITLTVYNGLPDLALSSDKSVMCSSETATLTVGNACAGKISWSTPENATFSIDNVSKKAVEYLSLSSTQDKVYKVRCELGECFSNQTNEAVQTITIKKAPTKPILTTLNADNSANPTHTVCSGNSIVISSSCSDVGAVFAWTAGLSSTDSNPYTLTTDVSNPQNKDYVYQASCTKDGCSSVADLTVKEQPISKPTHFFAMRNPIEIGGLVEIAALGCPDKNVVWSNGKAGIEVLKEHIHKATTYTAKCVVNGCSSLSTAPITVRVLSCEEAYPAPSLVGSIDGLNEVLPNSPVKLYASGCEKDYEWSNGIISGNNDGTSTIITVNPAETTEYKVRCKKDDGCKSAWKSGGTIKVKSCEEGVAAPSMIGSIDNLNDVTPNTAVKLYAAGCSNQYEWSDGTVSPKNDGNSTIITVKPSETTKYKVRCKVDEGCKSGWTAEFELKVKSCEEGVAAPSMIGSIDKLNDVTPNTAVKLYAAGCSNQYEWSDETVSPKNDGNSTIITVKPSETTKYKVRCKVDEGCKSGWTDEFEVTVKVSNTAPNWVYQNDICENNKSFKLEKDTNPNSLTYNETRKIEGGSLDCKCDGKSIEPSWEYQDKDVCIDSKPFKVEKDMNSCSPTFGTTRTIREGIKDCSICADKSKEPKWEKHSADICKNGKSYTIEKDVNECSPTYETIRTIEGGSASPPSKPTITLSKSDVLVNESVTVSASCSSGSTPTWTAPSGFSGGSYTPTSNTTFKAKCVTPENCSSDEDSKMVTVSGVILNPVKHKQPTLTRSKESIIKGGTVSVTGTCVTGVLRWASPSGFGGGSHKPESTTSYKAVCVDVYQENNPYPVDDSDEASIMVSVTEPPCVKPAIPNILISGATASFGNAYGIVVGNSVNITGICSNGNDLIWTSPSNFNGGIVTPQNNTNYSAKCTNSNCESNIESKSIELFKIIKYRTQRWWLSKNVECNWARENEVYAPLNCDIGHSCGTFYEQIFNINSKPSVFQSNIAYWYLLEDTNNGVKYKAKISGGIDDVKTCE